MSSGEALSDLPCALNSPPIIRTKSVAEREPRSKPSGPINMSSASPPPQKRRLSQPDVEASVQLKKPKLTESDTNTLPLKTATKGKDTVKDAEVSGGDLKPPKKAIAKRVRATASTKPPAAGDTSTGNPLNASEEFPNGHLYCHQCNKKRDATRESHPLPICSQLRLPSCLLRSHRGYKLHRGCEEVQGKVLQAMSEQPLRRGHRRDQEDPTKWTRED